ncbi:hypothetical protein VaNZ11_011989 [Volvox africanus]|uniref:Uncharacterized protein n=1 Tax=Volvox africanus TaxID=51714 RepID=A0ABQ5SE30_9CHLO|nr:hypothetical protein VaNZ11_011989 [Volvox africanus]
MGQCLGKSQAQSSVKDPFPDTCTESQICNYFVDRLPARVLSDGIHLLRGGPGPIMQGWTHELLNDAGVHSYQDRELLLKTRDEIVDAVEAHRQRLRQLHPSRSASCADCQSRTASLSPEADILCNGTTPGSASRAPDSPKTLKSSGVSGSTSVWESSAAESGYSLDKATARKQEEEAAATVAAEATAKATAFTSDGDGKSFRLTTDWLPAGLRLYRISEEIRHMASSGTLDVSVHSKAAGVLDGPAAAKVVAAAAAAGGGAALLQTRSKSRFYLSPGGRPGGGGPGGDGIQSETDGERNDGGCLQDRDGDVEAVTLTAVVAAAAAGAGSDAKVGTGATSTPDSSPSGASLLATGPSLGTAIQLSPRKHYFEKGLTGTAAAAVETGGGGRCESISRSREDSGSGEGSGSPGSTLGAESLTALTILEAPPPPSAPPQSQLVDSYPSDAECAVAGHDTRPLSPCVMEGDKSVNSTALDSEKRRQPDQQQQQQHKQQQRLLISVV